MAVIAGFLASLGTNLRVVPRGCMTGIRAQALTGFGLSRAHPFSRAQ